MFKQLETLAAEMDITVGAKEFTADNSFRFETPNYYATKLPCPEYGIIIVERKNVIDTDSSRLHDKNGQKSGSNFGKGEGW